MVPKLKAWNKKDKEMLEVEHIDFVNETVFLRRETEILTTWLELGFSSVDLLQSTGITDVVGKEIYEGDIVQCWFEKGFITMYHGSWGINIDKEYLYTSILYNYSDEARVIGNIYENPELLENI